ncbi:MAG: amidohydrolase family protein [Halodesulfurarchaeum sp.]
MTTTTTLEGTILHGPSFEAIDGRVVVEDGTITGIEEAPTDRSDIVLPAFVNAHTHLGDAIAKEAGRGLSLEELVAPPDGLKHQLLEAASREELVDGMHRALSFAQESGSAAVVDFREGGADGVNALRNASADVDIVTVIFGRGPSEVLDVADGYGASGANDRDFTEERLRARQVGKPFGIHAGEVDSSDVAPALDLDPDYLVHMVHATGEHLDRVAAAEVPVVVCPRSNLVTGVGLPDVSRLLEHTTVALGTDNVMLNSPSMFREMEFAAKCCDLSAPTVLEMATTAGAEVAGIEGGTIETGEPARLTVLDGDTDNLAGYQDPVRAVVRRAGVADVKRVLTGG